MYIWKTRYTASCWIELTEMARSSERFSFILARALFLHIGRRADEKLGKTCLSHTKHGFQGNAESQGHITHTDSTTSEDHLPPVVPRHLQTNRARCCKISPSP